MIDVKSLITNETIADVACCLAGTGSERTVSYIFLDRLYSQYNPKVHETREFREAIRQLVDKQILDMSPQMGLSRGINWKMPQCRKDKKYGFE
ncbi:hypothetical protein V8O11_00710 [Erwinia aphidicola]|uniref:hypothetical protein n=1 Tax=Erwinia TaxID=551 RepID=UPI00105CCE7A